MKYSWKWTWAEIFAWKHAAKYLVNIIILQSQVYPSLCFNWKWYKLPQSLSRHLCNLNMLSRTWKLQPFQQVLLDSFYELFEQILVKESCIEIQPLNLSYLSMFGHGSTTAKLDVLSRYLGWFSATNGELSFQILLNHPNIAEMRCVLGRQAHESIVN